VYIQYKQYKLCLSVVSLSVLLVIMSTIIKISLDNNDFESDSNTNYVLKYSFKLQKELRNRYLFNAILNLFVSPDKSLIVFGKWL